MSQFFGWSLILFLILSNLTDAKTGELRMNQYWTVPGFRMLLDIFQCLQVLDVVFSALKFTNNSVITTLLQVFSRVAMVISVFPLLKPKDPKDGVCMGVFLCIMNWSMIEVIRFGFYAVKQASPSGDSALAKIFGHLRYNVFIFAYVLGVAGENIAVYHAVGELNALDLAGARLPWTIRMPNKWNFVFDFKIFLMISPVFYLGGFPGLYIYMWRQRAKFYGGPSRDQKKAADEHNAIKEKKRQ